MKVTIKYNPYVIQTVITVDGEKPKPNSSLNVGKKRLQEWIEKLPDIIFEEYKDRNISIDFTGSVSDYEDLKASFDAHKEDYSVEYTFNKAKDINDVEKTIDDIFNDIQNGPIPELKENKITTAFQKAQNALFEVNVIATMSSGKSTLINALLGKQLMPAANEATTAIIVKIIDKKQDNFSAVVYDDLGHVIERKDNVTLEYMKEKNLDENVSTIELYGKIPFVESVGMRLVLVDTPGPNNSRNKHHQETTYRMISNSDKPLVLFVMNGEQLGINDEKVLLDYVCERMEEGGKQSRERFIFAVNRMDRFSPKKEGMDCIEHALIKVREGLEDRGIYNPNVFPVTSLAALELRTNEDLDDSMALSGFKSRTEKYNVLHLENYYNFSNLPQVIRQRIDNFSTHANENEQLELHTGIVSIEQAISQYINKYARTMKVYDLVQSFNEKLNEESLFAHLEDAIRKDKEVKKAMDLQIARIRETIHSAENAKERSKAIDSIDLQSIAKTKIDNCINTVRNKIKKLLSGLDNKVKKSDALKQGEELEKEVNAILPQINVDIDNILTSTYKDTIDKIVEEYKKSLSELEFEVNEEALMFNPAQLVSASLADMSTIISDHTEQVDESYKDVRKRPIFVPSKRRWYNPFSWFSKGGHWDEEKYPVWVPKFEHYVPMNDVASECFIDIQKQLIDIQESALDHVKSETLRLKEHLKKELVNIDKILDDKLNNLSKVEADNEAKAKEIEQKEKELKWLENIQQRVNDIINF